MHRRENVEYAEIGVDLTNASFTWGTMSKSEEETEVKKMCRKTKFLTTTKETPVVELNDIDLHAKAGDLVILSGKAGSGKTSLLYAIMEELKRTGGDSDVRGKIAFVEQNPFVLSSTIKNNITFGSPFDQKKFDNAVEVSQLTYDMAHFSDGIDTIIGEKGVSISGS